MRIAYLTANDPRDRRSWSGTLYQMARALETHCGDVYCVGPLPTVSAKIGKFVSRGLQKIGITYLYTHTTSISRELAKLAEAKLAARECDVIFAPAGSVVLANLKARLPIVYLSDTTFGLMRDYNPEFTRMSASSVRRADEIERRAICKAAQQVYPSSWAARSAVCDYGASPSSVHVVPFGANIDHWPDRSKALGSAPNATCRLLFVGRDWTGKGGDIAFETLVELERLGVPAELVVIGCRPPSRFRHPKLKVIPFLNKNNLEERARLESLYFDSHFALLPTRAECFSIALCEACAYGLPIISTHTGGLPELVRGGLNGLLLPTTARGGEYAARIRDLFIAPERYLAMRASSREEFEARLNWDAWGRRLRTILETACDSAVVRTA